MKSFHRDRLSFDDFWKTEGRQKSLEACYSKCETACGQSCGPSFLGIYNQTLGSNFVRLFEDEYYQNSDTCERKGVQIITLIIYGL